MGEVRIRVDRPPARDLEVDPSLARRIERRREAPIGSCGGVLFPDVCEAHRPSLARARRAWIVPGLGTAEPRRERPTS